MADGTTLTDVAAPFMGRQVVTRAKRLIDTTDHTDAVLIGLDSETPVDETDGLLVELNVDTREMKFTGCEGEVELSAYASQLLFNEMKKAGF